MARSEGHPVGPRDSGRGRAQNYGLYPAPEGSARIRSQPETLLVLIRKTIFSKTMMFLTLGKFIDNGFECRSVWVGRGPGDAWNVHPRPALFSSHKGVLNGSVAPAEQTPFQVQPRS